MTIEEFVDGLSREEQIVAMELLWQRLARDPSEQPPAWHRDVVSERISRLQSGKASLVDWADAKKTLAERAE